MKQIDFRNPMIAIAFSVLAIVCSFGCKKDDPLSSNSNSASKTYKFRIESSMKHPDRFKASIWLLNYRFNDYGLPHTVYVVGPDGTKGESIIVPSPLTLEYEVPGNFASMVLAASCEAIHSVDEEKEKEEEITFKLYVNDRLIYERLGRYAVMLQMAYNRQIGKYVISTGDERTEIDKL